MLSGYQRCSSEKQPEMFVHCIWQLSLPTMQSVCRTWQSVQECCERLWPMFGLLWKWEALPSHIAHPVHVHELVGLSRSGCCLRLESKLIWSCNCKHSWKTFYILPVTTSIPSVEQANVRVSLAAPGRILKAWVPWGDGQAIDTYSTDILHCSVVPPESPACMQYAVSHKCAACLLWKPSCVVSLAVTCTSQLSTP